MPQPTASILEHFQEVTDPRLERQKLHQLLDIIVIAICAVICGADTWVDVELFGRSKLAWVKSFLALPNGIPSHDTFGRVFGLLDPDEFQTGFLRCASNQPRDAGASHWCRWQATARVA